MIFRKLRNPPHAELSRTSFTSTRDFWYAIFTVPHIFFFLCHYGEKISSLSPPGQPLGAQFLCFKKCTWEQKGWNMICLISHHLIPHRFLLRRSLIGARASHTCSPYRSIIQSQTRKKMVTKEMTSSPTARWKFTTHAAITMATKPETNIESMWVTSSHDPQTTDMLMKCFYLDYCIICFVSTSETWGSVVGVKMECKDDTSSSRQTLLKGSYVWFRTQSLTTFLDWTGLSWEVN